MRKDKNYKRMPGIPGADFILWDWKQKENGQGKLPAVTGDSKVTNRQSYGHRPSSRKPLFLIKSRGLPECRCKRRSRCRA